MAKTHWKSLTDAAYLGAFSLEDGKDIVLTIKSAWKEMVTGSDGKKEEMLVIHWKEDELPMVCNSTNAKTITKVLGSPYIEDWVGHQVQIGSEKVTAFGDIVDALRVRKTKPKAQANETPIPCEMCAQVITAAYGMNPAQLAEYTKKTYGKAMCAECATKVADEQNNAK